MKRKIRKLKDDLYYILVDRNSFIRDEYCTYVNENIEEHNKYRYRHWWRLIRLNWHYRIVKNTTPLYSEQLESKIQTLDYYKPETPRLSVNELCADLAEYDVISFDIFDTAIYRKVEFPDDVFSIIAMEMGHNDFSDIRKKAEKEARDLNERRKGTREVTIEEIYNILYSCYGIEKKWQKREEELEQELSIVNPYIYQVYCRLLEMKKTIVFMSDMYLPRTVIEKMLSTNGYTNYYKLYLSNEYGLRKGDGKLQKVLLQDFNNLKVVHVGDNYASDVKKSIEAGLDAIYNSTSALPYREADMDNLAGSFYRAIVNTNLNNGLWDKSLHFEHGFRIGGILTAGFCEYLNQIAKERKIDKILFCARDCEIIWKAYNQFFKVFDNEYIQISRYAIMNITSERYLYDLSNRYILRYIDQNKSSKTIETIFKECGFGYLTEYLEKEDIDKFLFPASIDRKKIERFVFKYKNIIEQHNVPYTKAAEKYFKSVIGNAKNILIVDIGWSGTCITALKYFVEKHFPDECYHISGALMCTSRGKALTSSVSNGEIQAYVYSPLKNMDLARFMMPGGASGRSAIIQDRLHMPLEFMYTSTERSLAYYKEDKEGKVVFERMGNESHNKAEIHEMQDGILYFIQQYITNTAPYKRWFSIPAYVAFNPLKESIENVVYTKAVYKNYTYDAFTAPYVEGGKTTKFESLFEPEYEENESIQLVKNKKSILFVTPELIYTGAPRSLLRMCKVANSLGYHAIVWSAKPGPFIKEYEENDIEVRIISEDELEKPDVIRSIKSYDMAVCNTIVTDRYARICSFYIPTVWYIREATNIPDFTKNNPFREYTLKHSKNIYCVSDYAAKAISQFTKNKITVVHNSVEDEVEMAVPYVAGTGNTVKFVQFGTIEYRKGYDVLLAAYLAMPKEYQEKTELYFAGGFINSGTPYCSYLFSEMENVPNVHYLGVVRGERNKIRALSQMDVVVVASRDESCSLVALEGAMLSKPLIVTENVGAKYMVSDENGIIAKTDNVESLKNAMIQMIDNQSQLQNMGEASRKAYEQHASMISYTEDMKVMFQLCEKKSTLRFALQKYKSRVENSAVVRISERIIGKINYQMKRHHSEHAIVSLTSHPGRIDTVTPCIQSLLDQTCKPDKIILWLSKEQFPGLEQELPDELKKLQYRSVFEIKWVDDDLKPHKKYYYAMREYPEHPVIIVDDDVIYDNTLIEKLMNSYRKFPHCISCMRANMMMFRSDGTLRKYDGWLMGYQMLLDTPSYQLMPTGVGGVLYPPHSIPEDAFNIQDIKETCLFTDDLWLKMHAVSNGYSTVVPKDSSKYREIDGTRETALWRTNVNQNNNDVSIERIVDYFVKKGKKDLLNIIRKDRFC